MRNHLFICYFLILSATIINAQNIELYVSDGGNYNNPPWQILKFDENGKNPEVFIKEHLAWPQDILFLEYQGIVLISNLNTGKITKYDAKTGKYLGDFATGIGGTTRMKIGPDGLLYVLQWTGNGKVKRYKLDGTFVDDFTETGVRQSIGLDWDSKGNLYVSSYNGNFIKKYSPKGKDLGNFIDKNTVGPTNIVFDKDENLLVLDYKDGSIKKFDIHGKYLGVFISGLKAPEGIDFYPNGNIVVGNGGTKSVKVYTSDGKFIKELVTPSLGGLILPNAVRLRK